MTTEYSIYLVNKGASQKTFWAFLQRPEELKSDKKVFANSSAQLAVEPDHHAYDRFVIPVQYMVGAGASTQSVGLRTKVVSDFPQQTDLGEAWLAEYATVPPQKGPNITKTGESPGAERIMISSNGFDKVKNDQAGWFENMSFGIQTEAGYMGMTWAPDPKDARTITPKLTFYISTGDFGSNELADWTTVSTDAAEVTSRDFDEQLNATVTLLSDGSFSVNPGKPKISPKADLFASLVDSHNSLTKAHGDLVKFLHQPGLMSPSFAQDLQEDIVADVEWDESVAEDGEYHTYLTGEISVTTAVKAAAAFFVLSSCYFDITKVSDDGMSIRFIYSGQKGAEHIKNLLTAGKKILVGV